MAAQCRCTCFVQVYLTKQEGAGGKTLYRAVKRLQQSAPQEDQVNEGGEEV